MKRARIVIADDHSIILAGIRNLVEQDCDVVGQAADGNSLVEMALRLRPDLIILDIGMPMLNGIDAARQIRKAWPEAYFLFLTMHNSPIYLQEAMRVGNASYVLKTSAAEELRPAVQEALLGRPFISGAFGRDALDLVRASQRRHADPPRLTDRQRQVLQLITEGHTNPRIASILKVSVKTVQFHRAEIMRRVGVHSAAQLATIAIKEGLVSDTVPSGSAGLA